MPAFHQLTVLSPCPLPRNGPAIIVSNHTSALDPSLIQSRPPADPLDDGEGILRDAVVKRMFELIDSIPVNRNGNDVGATRAALRVLDKGEVLGVFPRPDRARRNDPAFSTPGSHSLRCASGSTFTLPGSTGRSGNCKM